MPETPNPPIEIPPIAEDDLEGGDHDQWPLDFDIRDMIDGYLS